MISRCSHIPSELSPVRQRERLSKELFMSPDRLIYMANQIGKFFESQGQNMAVPASIPKCARPSPRSGTPWCPVLRAARKVHWHGFTPTGKGSGNL